MKLSTVLSILLLGTFLACNDPEPTKATFDPSKVDLLIDQLIVDGEVENGAPPAPNATAEVLEITNAPSGVSVTYDNNLFIPLSISSADGFDGVYIQLSNEFENFSNAHYNIPLVGFENVDTLMLKFEIPGNIEPGLFFMNVSAYKGNTTSDVRSFPVQIASPQRGCDEGGKNFLTGDAQFSTRTYSFDAEDFPRDNFKQIIPQRLTLKAILFAEPDRVDIYLDKQWVGGTGTILEFGDTPPASTCDSESAATNGFKPRIHYISFTVMPGQRIDVYLSGCLGVTAWEYGFNCP